MSSRNTSPSIVSSNVSRTDIERNLALSQHPRTFQLTVSSVGLSPVVFSDHVALLPTSSSQTQRMLREAALDAPAACVANCVASVTEVDTHVSQPDTIAIDDDMHGKVQFESVIQVRVNEEEEDTSLNDSDVYHAHTTTSPVTIATEDDSYIAAMPFASSVSSIRMASVCPAASFSQLHAGSVLYALSSSLLDTDASFMQKLAGQDPECDVRGGACGYRPAAAMDALESDSDVESNHEDDGFKNEALGAPTTITNIQDIEASVADRSQDSPRTSTSATATVIRPIRVAHASDSARERANSLPSYHRASSFLSSIAATGVALVSSPIPALLPPSSSALQLLLNKWQERGKTTPAQKALSGLVENMMQSRPDASVSALDAHLASIGCPVSVQQIVDAFTMQAKPSSQELMVRLLSLAHTAPPEWQEDDASSQCMLCARNFHFLRRRHHCRACGILVCDSCSRQRMPMPWAVEYSIVREKAKIAQKLLAEDRKSVV